jgi:hypothetical protein
MKAAPDGAEASTMTPSNRTALCGAARAGEEQHSGVAIGQQPWVSLTKGECLMLALALRRLSRANGGARREEDQR